MYKIRLRRVWMWDPFFLLRGRKRIAGKGAEENHSWLGNVDRLGPEAVDLPNLIGHVCACYWVETVVR